ncbi:MAG: MBL fold metallo-hydrolase [Spirochaetales bacterium]|nr:MBL fold metallo-hydrolase [Spirochaetales bacterium]
MLKRLSACLLLLLMLLVMVSCASTAASQGRGKTLDLRFFSTAAQSWGDCTFIRFPDGQTMLIDCGTNAAGSEILAALKKEGIKHIDYFVISHYHSDHVNGLQVILPEISFGQVYTTGYYPTDFSWVELNFRHRGVPVTYVKAGDSFDIGDVHFDVLWPTAEMVAERPQTATGGTDGPAGTVSMNCRSMVLKMTYGNNSVLFTGDIYVEAEDEMMKLYGDDPSVLDCDILKIMHHGYSNANGNEKFIQAVSPQFAFSMGTATMEMTHYLYYYKAGTQVFMSWYNGNCTVSMDGENISVTAEKEGVNKGYLNYAESWEKLQQVKNN